MTRSPSSPGVPTALCRAAARRAAGGYKLAGRVGNSPIIGSGLYVDGQVGAAGATGLGENVMRYCGSFLVVDLMARGASPQEACIETVLTMGRKDPLPLKEMSLNFVAVDRHGRHGGAGSDAGFQYSVTTREGSQGDRRCYC